MLCWLKNVAAMGFNKAPAAWTATMIARAPQGCGAHKESMYKCTHMLMVRHTVAVGANDEAYDDG